MNNKTIQRTVYRLLSPEISHEEFFEQSSDLFVYRRGVCPGKLNVIYQAIYDAQIKWSKQPLSRENYAKIKERCRFFEDGISGLASFYKVQLIRMEDI